MKDNKKTNINNENDDYIKLNAKCKLFSNNKDNFSLDFEAAQSYVEKNVLPKYKIFKSVEERFEYLIKNKYYEEEIINKYSKENIRELYEISISYNFKFPSLMGAIKFFNAYSLKSFDNNEYLEIYSDRVLMNSLFLANGNFIDAKNILIEIMSGKFQPATPTFLNAGKKQRGEYISCYLLRVEDNMESICRAISTSLQLSKRGGGVALCLTNLRETGAPIKNISGLCSGVVPVMKILEDSFSYADQLGQRQGAGAAYLNAHHPDILKFLDTKRENADEKIRIKSLSLGIVIPDITFDLAKRNETMALFSPYDIEQVYNKSMTDISISEKYYEMLSEPKIKKTFISARKLFQAISELHFESGYPYLLFEDTVNKRNPNKKNGRIVMSNLCSEIVQVSTASEYNDDLSFKKIGEDISCNLGSLNIDKVMSSETEFYNTVYNAVLALDHVSRSANINSAISVKNGNNKNHAIGLGAMNLHGFLATNKIMYNSKEAIDFTNIFFYTLAYNAFKASNQLAKKVGAFELFKNSEYADGVYFKKYTKCDKNKWTPNTERIKKLFEKFKIKIPTQQDWITLSEAIKKTGIANSHLLAVAPTGSISYLSSCTPSLQPVVSTVEVRKEGKIGRIYVPAYNINFDNMEYYAMGAYEIGPEPIINIVAAAQQHVDQAISLTLFMTDKATTRDLNKAYINAFSKGCSSIYYVRIRQDILKDSENYECDSCMI